MTSEFKSKIVKLIRARKVTKKEWDKVPSRQKNELEKKWDVEHAYYSATLEGNGLDRKRFDDLAREIK
ncbi:hypothetical protein HYT01_00630 [Candidatus Giovannonibacteria bacterium]|nr:hypothetical protein [Candidatus Giovannonibacteria bacterium]